jgi:hypothetical protein
MQIGNGRRACTGAVVLAVLSLLSSGCEHAARRPRKGPYGPVPDPYPVYRPAYEPPKPNQRYLNGYAGFNYGRLSDWGRVRPRPGENTIPVMEAPVAPSS